MKAKNTTLFMSTRLIPLTRGLSAIVDAADYEWLSQWKWCINKGSAATTFYAVRNAANNETINNKHVLIAMHRAIIGLTVADRRYVDHVDGNGLNNVRSNLRIATPSENGCNDGIKRNNTSGYKGVSWYKGKWRAAIVKNRKWKHLGLFATKEEAYAAYCAAAKILHGKFANIGK